MRQQALQMLLGNQMPHVGFGPPVGAMSDRDAAMMQNAIPPQMPAQSPSGAMSDLDAQMMRQQMPQETPESVIGRLFQGVDPLSPQAAAIREQMMQRYRMGR